MNVHHDTATPTLSVIDSRSLMIRSVGYCRRPDSPDIDPRITRQVFDAAGRQVASWDPRLWGAAPKPNLATTYGLSGQALLTDSVDAGWQLSLPDQARSLRCSWDARGSECHRDYDDLQRPIVVTEQAHGEPPRVVERLSYADADDVFAQHNQCGRLIRHDDPAGTRLIRDYGLAGAERVESRRMLTDLDLPDWPSDPEHRDVLLEEHSYATRYAFYPTGELKEQTDAMGNAQTRQYNVAGQLSATWLLPGGEGKPPTRLVSDIRYKAHEQIEHETAGNGVMTRAEYSPEDGRLLQLSAAAGEQTPLQNLQYVYDPVGNIVSLEDKTQAVTYFNHQRIEPVSRYRYDSLYQLVEAKGWEVSQPSHGPALPNLLPTPLDPKQRRNYTQTFAYDAAGNLITRHHSGAPVFSMFTSAYSNRSLAQRDDGSLPGEPQISEGFDRAGNQLQLQRGQAMNWDVRNQLRRVTLVRRRDEPNDDEGYVYDRPGHRLRKTCLSQTSGQTLKSEVRYLPGVEVHREANGKERHVVSVEAGRNQVRMLHWPEVVEGDQLRYSLSDHLGSISLELDDSAGILSQEHYYPFGGTACWAGKSAVVAKYKTSRYSGKERDATGLYYYGHRFYAPWLQRWISPDPLKISDGLNVYVFVASNPVVYLDRFGLFGEIEGSRPLVIDIDELISGDQHYNYVGEQNQVIAGSTLDARPGALWGDPEEHMDSIWGAYEYVRPRSYFDPSNIQRFEMLNKLGGSGPVIVSTMFEHAIDPLNNYKVNSKHWNGVDEFSNTFLPEVWKLQSNFKLSNTKDYFASQVVAYQYELVSKTMGFYGVLPSVVENQYVMNKQTLQATAGVETLSPEMLDVFLNKTAIGKGTQIALNAFQMKAEWVSRRPDPVFSNIAHFSIGVVPLRNREGNFGGGSIHANQ